MINFFELEFEIPDGYIFADNKTMDELINSRIGEIDYQFLTMMKEMISSGSMAMTYNPIKYDPSLGSVKEYINIIAKKINCSVKNILVASTGVIGEQLDYKKINAIVPELTVVINGLPM